MRSLEVRFLTAIVRFVMVKMHLDRKAIGERNWLMGPTPTSTEWHSTYLASFAKQLLWTINNGGTLIGGKMPAFKDILKEEEKTAVLDYLFSLWPDKIKKLYNERFGTNI